MFRSTIFSALVFFVSSTCIAETATYRIGTYTNGTSEGVYELTVDTNNFHTSLQLAFTAENPSYLLANSNELFVANETSEGAITYFKNNTAIQQLEAGADTCHLAMSADNNWLAAANYSSGSVSVYQRSHDNFVHSHTFVHEGSGANPQRQEAPHAHWVGWLNNGTVLTVDLGTDEIYQHNPTNQESRTVYQAQAGDGIRHMALTKSEEAAFIVNELSNTLVMAARNDNGIYTEQQRVSLLPDGYDLGGYASHISLNKLEDRVYVANRGHNSIAVFRVDEQHQLHLMQHRDISGDWPRMFLIDEDRSLVLVANQLSSNVAIFQLNSDGSIGAQLANVEVDAPTAIVKID